MQHDKTINPLIAREILAYLGNVPRELDAQGTAAAADTAIKIGNCLLWMHGHIAPDEHKIEQPLDEPAQTVWALGKQFRAVGLKLWDKPKSSKLETRVEYLESCIASFVMTGHFTADDNKEGQ
jgi:hypothetical protein